MTTPLVDRIPFAKIAIVLAAGMLIGFGLCGIGAGIALSSPRPAPPNPVLQMFLALGAGSFWLSFLGLVVLLPIWLILALMKSSKGE